MDIKSVVLELISQSESVVFTDIQIETGKPIMWRRPTGWHEIENVYESPTQEDIAEFLTLIDQDWKSHLKRDGAMDRPIELTHSRLRCNAYYTKGNTALSISIRKHSARPIPFVKLGFPNQIANSLNWSKGLFIVTGSTGSGKTTTLASMIDYINETRGLHIITIENPIEYRIENKKSIISQVEVPTDSPTFSAALRNAMRQKPDVIMIGEVRDRDTAEAMFSAAESGHLIMATLHTSSAEGALTKLLSFFPAEEQKSRAKMLSNALAAIICQSMIPRVNGESSVVVNEILFNTTAASQQMIESVDKHHSIREYIRKGDDKVSCHMNTKLLQLVSEKEISVESALRASHSPMELRDAILAKTR